MSAKRENVSLNFMLNYKKKKKIVKGSVRLRFFIIEKCTKEMMRWNFQPSTIKSEICFLLIKFTCMYRWDQKKREEKKKLHTFKRAQHTRTQHMIEMEQMIWMLHAEGEQAIVVMCLN